MSKKNLNNLLHVSRKFHIFLSCGDWIVFREQRAGSKYFCRSFNTEVHIFTFFVLVTLFCESPYLISR